MELTTKPEERVIFSTTIVVRSQQLPPGRGGNLAFQPFKYCPSGFEVYRILLATEFLAVHRSTNSLESQTFTELQTRSKPAVEPSFVRINRLLIGGHGAERPNISYSRYSSPDWRYAGTIFAHGRTRRTADSALFDPKPDARRRK